MYPAHAAPESPPRLLPEIWLRLRWRAGGYLEYLLLSVAVLAAALPGSMSLGQLIALARRSLKRSLDLLGALVGLLLALPLFLVVPVLIKLDSPGPVFYRQERVGLNRRRRDRRVFHSTVSGDRRYRERRRTDQYGEVFKLIKFRSMVDHAERSCGPVWATKNDPRITRLGRFLRRTRIDEIPQLLNVLLGQMSLVGPRPERPHFVTRFSDRIDRYPTRQRVKPGITGLAQVESGYDSSEDDVHRKVEYDLRYISRWNPALDLQILLRTVRVVVSGRGSR